MAVFSGHIKGPASSGISSGLLFRSAQALLLQGDACRAGPCSQTSHLEVPQGPLGELQPCSWGCPAANQTLVNPGTLESPGLSVPSLAASSCPTSSDGLSSPALNYLLLPPCFRNYTLLSSCCQICIHTPSPHWVAARLQMVLSAVQSPLPPARLPDWKSWYGHLQNQKPECHPYLGTLRLHIPAPSQAQPLWRHLPDTLPASLPRLPCISRWFGVFAFPSLPVRPCWSFSTLDLLCLNYARLEKGQL